MLQIIQLQRLFEAATADEVVERLAYIRCVSLVMISNVLVPIGERFDKVHQVGKL